MSIGSPDFILSQGFRGFLETRRPGLSGSSVVKKNELRFLRDCPPELLRPEDTACSRSVLRGCTDLSGAGDSTGLLSGVQGREAGETRLARRQSVLHEEIRLLCGETVPGDDDPGRGQRDPSRLAHDQGAGEAVHEGAASEDGDAGAESNRHRRDLDPEGSHLSNHRQRFGETSSHLVRWSGPIGREHGPVLQISGAQEGQIVTGTRARSCRRTSA